MEITTRGFALATRAAAIATRAACSSTASTATGRSRSRYRANGRSEPSTRAVLKSMTRAAAGTCVTYGPFARASTKSIAKPLATRPPARLTITRSAPPSSSVGRNSAIGARRVISESSCTASLVAHDRRCARDGHRRRDRRVASGGTQPSFQKIDEPHTIPAEERDRIAHQQRQHHDTARERGGRDDGDGIDRRVPPETRGGPH